MIPAESSDLTVQVPNGRRSWSLTDESGLGPIFGSRFSRVVENVRSYGGTGDERSVTFATKEARFHSMNLCIRGGTSLFDFIRCRARVEGYLQQPDESKPLGKAAQERLQSFPFGSGFNSIEAACRF